MSEEVKNEYDFFLDRIVNLVDIDDLEELEILHDRILNIIIQFFTND